MPVSIVHKTSGDNKGSCSKYGFYLNKENQEYLKNGQPEKQQHFFNQKDDAISTIAAINSIDENYKGKGLKNGQDKYFTLTLNFSDKELKHIAKEVSGKNIETVDQLNNQEFKKYNQVLRNYTRKAMKNYSDNFNKDIDENDIKYFAKVEHNRTFKGYDEEVKNGNAKSGDSKPGLNSHVHITVSRMHKKYRVSLSPLANARNSKNLVLNGKNVKGGFDRSNWKQLNEDTFDKEFGYARELGEKFQTNRTLAHGTFQEKEALKQKLEKIENQKENKSQISL